MAYYVVLNFDIEDAEAFREYERRVAGTLPSDVKVLIFDDEQNDWEGHSRCRLVLLEFESAAAASQWYASEGYQQAAPYRRASTAGWVRGVVPFGKARR